MSGARVARMVEADLDEVLRIERRSFDAPWERRHFLAGLSARSGATYRTLRSGRVLIGYVCAWRAGDEIEIHDLAVHPDHRGRGWARHLLDELIREAAQGGVARILLEVRPANEAARRLYGGFGFVQCGIRRRYYADGEDALVLERRLAPGRPSGEE